MTLGIVITSYLWWCSKPRIPLSGILYPLLLEQQRLPETLTPKIQCCVRYFITTNTILFQVLHSTLNQFHPRSSVFKTSTFRVHLCYHLLPLIKNRLFEIERWQKETYRARYIDYKGGFWTAGEAKHGRFGCLGVFVSDFLEIIIIMNKMLKSGWCGVIGKRRHEKYEFCWNWEKAEHPQGICVPDKCKSRKCQNTERVQQREGRSHNRDTVR